MGVVMHMHVSFEVAKCDDTLENLSSDSEFGHPRAKVDVCMVLHAELFRVQTLNVNFDTRGFCSLITQVWPQIDPSQLIKG